MRDQSDNTILHPSSFIPHPWWLPVLCCFLFTGGEVLREARGQERPAARIAEAISLDVDTAARKKLEVVRDHLALQQWEEAFSVLENIAREHREGLIEAAPGRYLNVAVYCNLLPAALPPDALAVYRKEADRAVEATFLAGKEQRDEELLERVVERAFASSYSDEAMLLLGELAWERGEIQKARRLWERILPPADPHSSAAAEEVIVSRANYPDTDLNRAEVLARLVLCSLASGETARAEAERQAFAEIFPEAEGSLAGRRGNLNNILTEVAERFGGGLPVRHGGETSTFAGNSARNGRASGSIDVGGEIWSVPLPKNRFLPETVAKPALGPVDLLGYYPVIFEEMVLVTDGNRILVWNLFTGEPYFNPTESEPEADSDENSEDLSSAVLYPPASEFRASRPLGEIVGLPRQSLTVEGGRLFARLGSPVTSFSQKDRQLRPVPDRLLCLDLAEKEGGLLWTASTREIGEEWSFGGAPLVEGDRLYVVLRQNHPQTAFRVACYDAQSGKLIWNRPVASALPPVEDSKNLVSHELLSYGDGTLFFSTDSGAVAALGADDGRLRWVVTYERDVSSEAEARNETTRWGLKPPLYADGVVYAAPNDLAGLMAIDAGDGRVLWRRELRGGIRHLLGAEGERLFVSGDRLWALNRRHGGIEWTVGYEDPAGFGYGRGLLAEGEIWWPLREEILIVRQRDGRLSRRVQLVGYPRFAGSGHLTLGSGVLLIAEPERLRAFGEAGVVRSRERSLSSVSGPAW